MKKYFKSFVCILIALLLTACAAAGNPQEQVQKSEPQEQTQEPETLEQTQSPEAQEQVQQSTTPAQSPQPQPASKQMIGAEYVYSRSVANPMVDENTVLPASVPVFHNIYPVGHGGPMYETTQAHKQKMEQELFRFVTMLRGKEPNPDEIGMDSEFNIYAAVYQDEDFEIRSTINGFTISIAVDQLPEQVTAETIEGNLLLRTAMDYLGIENPEISLVDQYDLHGEASDREVTITNHVEDLMQTALNRTISSISVVHFGDLENAHLGICHEDMPEKYQSFPTISLADAVAAARAEHSELPADATVTADIFYTTTINPAYFIPCYQLYFTDSETGISQSVGLTMIDIADFEASLAP